MTTDDMEQHPGKLIVICGCMFSGKTTRLIQLLSEFVTQGYRVTAYKHRLDARYDPVGLRTHDGTEFNAVPVADAAEIAEQISTAEVVGIDEAQFFGCPLICVCSDLRSAGRTVIVAGIDHDAWGQDFPPLPQLQEIADRVEHLHVPCTECGRPALYSQRIVPVTDADMVGGPNEYRPRCAAHFTPLPAPAPVYP